MSISCWPIDAPCGKIACDMPRLLITAFLLLDVLLPLGWSQDASQMPAQVQASSLQALRKVAPVYPPLARQARIQGTVVLRVIINKAGDVQDVNLFSGHPMLAPAAMEAVRQSKYRPYIVDGQAVEVETDIQVNFKLADDPPPAGVVGSIPGGVSIPPPMPGVPRAPEAVMRTLRIKDVEATYPRAAIRQRIEGIVVLDVLVDASGDVENATLISGHPTLAPAAIEAVKQWRYKPYMVDGAPGAVETTARLEFRVLQNGEDGIITELAPAAKFPTAPETSSPQRVRVSGGVLQGLLVRKVDPEYPPEARAQNIQGIVLLRVRIDKEGSVSRLDIVSGPPELHDAAMEAVRLWKYQPYMLNGQPVEVESQVQVNFTLEQ